MNLFYANRMAVVFTVLLHFATSQHAAAQKLSVYDLTVDYQTNPLSTESLSPRFSWKIKSNQQNTVQQAYDLKIGDKIFHAVTDQSVLVACPQPALKAGTPYSWQVRVSDNHGHTSGWSARQFFRTGIAPGDWVAKWVTVSGTDSSSKSPLFRKDFSLKKEVKSATLYITAKGLYEARLNGKRISNNYLAPGWTSYNKRLQYQVYDVTASLTKGSNVMGIMMGDGWYKGRVAFNDRHDFYGNTRAALMQMQIVYTDGSKEVVITDNSWKYAYGAILASSIYDGEIYDARLEKTGWDAAAYREDATWKNTAVAEKGAEELVSMSGPPVKKHEVFKPVKIFTTPAGEQVVDFGQNLVGWVVLKAQGPAGAKITLSHAEVLDKAGNFYTENLRSARQQNTYILKPGTEQTFEPHFTFQGFRYVKVEGYPGTLKADDLTAVALYSDMATTGKLSTSNALLNQLQHNIEWGQKGNFVDLPTDCPQRDERLGWTGDAQVFFNTAAYNMNVAGFFTKWLRDVEADQLPNGSIPFVVPNVLNASDAGSAGWGDVATIIPWGMYSVYGDKQILQTQYSSMKGWVDYITASAKNNLWNTGSHFGDWLFYRPDDDNDGRAAVTDKHMIAQCFYAHSTHLLAQAAGVLGKTDDTQKYTALLQKIKDAYVREYLTANGRLVSNTQTAYVLALQFDMLPEPLRQQAAERLVANVRDYGNHLTTGFLGTPYLCHVLSRYGYTDVAYDLLMQESYPSWLYPVKMGATTIWERWDGLKPDGRFQTPGMNSFNHYAYGAIGDWMYKNIAGINPGLDRPGYKTILITPQPGGKLTSASGQLETLYGTVTSAWQIEKGNFNLDVNIPVNTTATVIMPDKSRHETGSGYYHFSCKTDNN
ncbi:glycoside hydrolase family 78 protein [Mucilaginibacter sp. Bleaf8]|uniref:glycoside hydrolase family 78 protein n=1 Tax=Mucilaginibacter sp. Bleaf8 TaxID=2834430 RepID=UPI001BCABF3A|nr:glycoside hydrolase family 78 protein [Mucilaginibacter sp. Bleaf8]MBS7566700.1 glycoside hydrolase family 78 protein [Mucilaginibacter sp. Bleaf8]